MASTIFQVSTYFLVLLASGVGAQRDFLRKVSTDEIERTLEASLSDILSGQASPAATRRLSAIEANLWQTFQSLPKNSRGRLGPEAVRHIVHGFFAREHGWQLKGLEPHSMQASTAVTKVHDVSILQDKAPALVEGLLMKKHQDHGLSLTDIVAMVSALEQLVFDESVLLLEAAYRLNDLPVTKPIDEASLHRVLKSYLVLFGQGSKADLFNATKHQLILAARPREDIDDFESNAVWNFEYARRHQRNPFTPPMYSFEVAAEIVGDLAQRYGKWQNAECRDMKTHLAELDPDSTGRVPLGLLYAQPPSASYHFSESADYLRQIGALDETSSTPKVLLANYITGPSNCIASSAYYSVCCMSNCDSIMDEIVHKSLAPTASPQRLLDIMRNITQDKAVSESLSQKLQAIADKHGGEVPVHGRLFAQWLHFAFPHECPYPTILENTDMLSASQWHTQYSASSEERDHHVQSVDDAALTAGDIELDQRWSDYEVIPVMDDSNKTSGSAASVVRGIVMITALIVAMRSMLAAWRSVKGTQDHKKSDDVVFQFSV